MILLSAVLSLLNPITFPTPVSPDSVSIQFTYEKMEPGTAPKTTYYYELMVENNSNEAIYVIIPRWFETKPLKEGIMKSVDNDSHDGILEYCLATPSDPSFEIYMVKAHSKMIDTQCKLRTKNEDMLKKSSIDIPIYLVHDVKIGELKWSDYVAEKDFYGTNIPYSMVDLGTTKMNVHLK